MFNIYFHQNSSAQRFPITGNNNTTTKRNYKTDLIKWAVFNTPLSFHSTGRFIGIPLVDYQNNPKYIKGRTIHKPIINQQGFWTLLTWTIGISARSNCYWSYKPHLINWTLFENGAMVWYSYPIKFWFLGMWRPKWAMAATPFVRRPCLGGWLRTIFPVLWILDCDIWWSYTIYWIAKQNITQCHVI